MFTIRPSDSRNLIGTYIPDVVTGTESWLGEEISNVEVLRLTTQLSEETGTIAVAEGLFV